MSVLELKGNLLQLLARLENHNHLATLNEIATQFVEEEISTHDIEGYNDLSPEQQTDLLEAIEQTYDESKLIPHEEIIRRFDKLLQQ
jgi:F0F1-type ATP synthase delta subunit